VIATWLSVDARAYFKWHSRKVFTGGGAVVDLGSFRLRRELVPVLDVPRSETVVFRLMRPFADQPSALQLTRASFEEAEVQDAFAHSLQITPADKHSGIHAARAMLLVYDGQVERAQDLASRLASERRLSDYHADALAGAIKRAERLSATESRA
jgi:hypothetical protein